MADYNTWATVKAAILRETDMEDEDFVPPAEMIDYVNEAIDEVEKILLGLSEDYMLTRTTITLVDGTEEYALPSDVFAHKIRSIIYRNGSTVYEIKRIRDWKKFEEYEAEKSSSGSTKEYRYFLLHTTAGSPKILLSPTPAEAGTYPKIWYLRNANKVTTTADTIDIPEGLNYIKHYVKCKILFKERSPAFEAAKAELEGIRDAFIEAMQVKTPDNASEIEPDFSYYNDMT